MIKTLGPPSVYIYTQLCNKEISISSRKRHAMDNCLQRAERKKKEQLHGCQCHEASFTRSMYLDVEEALVLNRSKKRVLKSFVS